MSKTKQATCKSDLCILHAKKLKNFFIVQIEIVINYYTKMA